MTATSNPRFKSLDKQIMQARAALEAYWFDGLTTTMQDNWTTLWSVKPPADMQGRTYVTSNPSAWDQIKVTHATAYAWSQMFGVFWFRRSPVPDPATLADYTLVIDGVTNSGLEFTMGYHIDTPPSDGVDLMVYAGRRVGSITPPTLNDLRPMCAMTNQPTTGSLSFTNCMTDRYGTTPSGTIIASLASADANNMLVKAANPVLQPAA